MNIREFRAAVDQNHIAATLIRFLEKSSNEQLVEMSEAFKRLIGYQYELEAEVRKMEQEVSEFRAGKNRAVLRARKAEAKLDDLEAKVKDLENKLKIFAG